MEEVTPDAVSGTAPKSEIAEDEKTVLRGEKMEETLSREGILQKCFAWASCLGPLFLMAILALCVWPIFLGQWDCGPLGLESIQILERDVLAKGLLLAPAVGTFFQWPGFPAFSVVMFKFFEYVGEPLLQRMFIPFLMSISVFLALLGVWCLGMVAGFGRRASLTGGLILLCSPAVLLFTRFLTPDILATSLTLFALVCFCRGWRSESAGLAVPLGFLLTALATLTGGPYYLALSLLSTAIFLGWAGRFSRASKFDALFGFTLFLVTMGFWLGGVILLERVDGYFQNLYTDFLSGVRWSADGTRLLFERIFALLPWSFLVFFVSWNRVLREALKTLKDARTEKAASAFIWIALVVAVLLTFINDVGAMLMTCCLAALLLAKALLRLSSFGSRFFYLCVVLFLFIAALGMMALGFDFSSKWLEQLLSQRLFFVAPGLIWPIAGVCCLAAAFILARAVDLTKAAGAMLGVTILAIALAQPFMLWFEPQLGPRKLQIGIWRRGDVESVRRGSTSAPEAGETKRQIALDPALQEPSATSQMPASMPRPEAIAVDNQSGAGVSSETSLPSEGKDMEVGQPLTVPAQNEQQEQKNVLGNTPNTLQPEIQR